MQSGLFLRLQVIQGMSFATLGAIISIASQAGFATVFGSLMVASLVLVLIGYLKIFSKIVKYLIPEMVAGTVIVVIGLSLIFITWNSLIMIPGSHAVNFLEALVTFVAMLIFMRLGSSANRTLRLVSVGSVIYAIVIGTVVAAFFGHVDMSPVKTAPWFSLPKVFPFGTPVFDMNAILIMTFIMVIVMVESIGTWFSISEMSGEPLSNKRIDKGVIGEGLGCFIGTFIGGLPVTSYASNSGVLAITKVFSRHAAFAAGVIAIVMALCPKLMFLIAVVPGSVIWGIYGIISIAIMLSGMSCVGKYLSSERNGMVFGISILATVGTSLLPPAIVHSLPPILAYLLGSSICIGALTAIVVNLLFKKRESLPEAEFAN